MASELPSRSRAANVSANEPFSLRAPVASAWETLPQLVPAGNADESQRALIVRLGPHLKRPMTAIGTWRTLVPTMTMSAFDPKRTS